MILASIIVAFIKENKALDQAAKDFLKGLKNSENLTSKDLKDIKDVKDILELLKDEDGIDFLSTIMNNLSYDQNKNVFIRVFGQNPNIAQKADNLGKIFAIGATGLIASGILGGAIGANLGVIGASLGVVGAGVAISAQFIAIGCSSVISNSSYWSCCISQKGNIGKYKRRC